MTTVRSLIPELVVNSSVRWRQWRAPVVAIISRLLLAVNLFRVLLEDTPTWRHLHQRRKQIIYHRLQQGWRVCRVNPELRRVTCHMRSHCVTCHPTQVNAPRLNPRQTGRCSIYLPQRDGRLSWSWCWLYTEMAYLSAHPSPDYDLDPATDLYRNMIGWSSKFSTIRTISWKSVHNLLRYTAKHHFTPHLMILKHALLKHKISIMKNPPKTSPSYSSYKRSGQTKIHNLTVRVISSHLQ